MDTSSFLPKSKVMRWIYGIVFGGTGGYFLIIGIVKTIWNMPSDAKDQQYNYEFWNGAWRSMTSDPAHWAPIVIGVALMATAPILIRLTRQGVLPTTSGDGSNVVIYLPHNRRGPVWISESETIEFLRTELMNRGEEFKTGFEMKQRMSFFISGNQLRARFRRSYNNDWERLDYSNVAEVFGLRFQGPLVPVVGYICEFWSEDIDKIASEF